MPASSSPRGPSAGPSGASISWPSTVPFVLFHLMALYAFALPVRAWEVAVCVGLYVLRMWGITAGYHRYFAHRAFKTSRVFAFVLALSGTLALQKGVLWWAAHHRNHHRESDGPGDLHSPLQWGFWWSHVGWLFCPAFNPTAMERVRDFAGFPELRWLNRFWIVPPVALAVGLFAVGGLSLLVWGFFVSTVLLWHATFAINSLAHVFGSRPFRTKDTSRNNWLLALFTLGEGWHNNHHYHQNTANQGWRWWEVDLSYYSLKVLSWVGVVWDLRMPPPSVQKARWSGVEEEALPAAPPVAESP